jgi:hypothetical protein
MKTSRKNTMAKWVAMAAAAAALALSAVTPSFASNSNDGGPFSYEPSPNGSVWSYYPGYTAQVSARRAHGPSAYRARAQAPGFRYRGGSRSDNPAGSDFQSWGNSDSMGCPC